MSVDTTKLQDMQCVLTSSSTTDLRHLRDKLAKVERVASQRVGVGDHNADPCEKCRRPREQETAHPLAQQVKVKDT